MWIEVCQPSDGVLALLQQRFRLHTLAVEDSMRPAQLPKLDLYDGQIFAVVKIASLEGDEIRYADLNAFVSTHHIITVRHDGESARISDKGKTEGGLSPTKLRPDFILHALMDLVVRNYYPVVQMIEEEVLSMEQRVLDAFLSRDEITRLFRLRREAIRFQHVLTRMSDVCAKLANLQVPCIGKDAKPYFRDVHDQLVRVNSMISGLIDVVQAVFAASNLLERQRQGATTRQLAGWAAILGVPTAIAGIYDINQANLPAYDGAHGHLIVIALMLSICIGLYIRFRRLRWL
jgi:magnesium transporter